MTDKPVTTQPIQQVLRDLYPDHPLMMQAADEIDRLEQKIKEMEGEIRWLKQ